MDTELFRCEKIESNSLFDINLSLSRREILMVMGLRSSNLHVLSDILSGHEQDYRGTLYLNGKRTVFTSPEDAKRQGVYVIRDPSSVIENFRLSENLFLAPHPQATFFAHDAAMEREADKLFDWLELELRGHAYGSQCDIFERHAVMTARAIAHGARILIFENVVNSYTDEQTGRFQKLLWTLRSKNFGILVFSSVISDAFALADRLLILRSATIAHVFDKCDLDRENILRALNPPTLGQPKRCQELARFAQLIDFTPQGYSGQPLSLSIPKASITSLVTENALNFEAVAESFIGERPFRGTLLIEGRPRRFSSCRDAIAAGIGLIWEPASKSLFDNLTAQRNVYLMLGEHTDFGILENDRLNWYVARQAAEKYGIDPALLNASNVKKLSAFERLSLAVLRWLVLNPQLLILIHPYCSLDELERLELSRLLSKIEAGGISVLILSPLVSDIAKISDQTFFI
ncbi:MAG: hypothetical protein Q4C45_01030 [Oscillospiraceae bacterium]|nr:hypothetical protein [Oscillospiraceae bacterium]